MKAVAVAILAIFAVAEANVAKIWKCENVPQDACTVNKLRITPCDENPCQLKMGRNVFVEVDFTPQFSSDNLKMEAYWVTFFEPISISPKYDACQYTTCPVNSGIQSTVTKRFPIPKGLITWFDLKLRLKIWNAAYKSQVCCFETKVKLY